MWTKSVKVQIELPPEFAGRFAALAKRSDAAVARLHDEKTRAETSSVVEERLDAVSAALAANAELEDVWRSSVELWEEVVRAMPGLAAHRDAARKRLPSMLSACAGQKRQLEKIAEALHGLRGPVGDA